MSLYASATGPLIVAHRGASHDAPENTLTAFRLALEQGADALECDVHLTRDQHLVVHHDHTLDRLCKTNVAIADLTLAQIKQFDVGSWKGNRWAGEKIPTIEELLDILPPGKLLYIEIKVGRESVPILKQAIVNSRKARQVVCITFLSGVVDEVKKLMPAVPAYWLTTYKRDDQSKTWNPSLKIVMETLKWTRANGLGTALHESVDENFVKTLQQAGYLVNFWTIDDPESALKAARLGAVSLTTNRPQWLREQMALRNQALPQ